MRKLKLQVQISADGYVAGPNGELDWMTFNLYPKLLEFIVALTDRSDTILLGRKMSEGFGNIGKVFRQIVLNIVLRKRWLTILKLFLVKL